MYLYNAMRGGRVIIKIAVDHVCTAENKTKLKAIEIKEKGR